MFDISVSPCSIPNMPLKETVQLFSQCGYTSMEVFTSWAKSAFHPDHHPAEYYRDLLHQHGLSVSSIHLPALSPGEVAQVLPDAMQICDFAIELGAPVAIVKAHGTGEEARRAYAAGYKLLLEEFLDSPLTLVLTNHYGTCIETLRHYEQVMDLIDDPDCCTVLEVGHFHSAGINWQRAYDALENTFHLVHIKDQVGSRSVPFGDGEIDLPGLFSRLMEDEYDGAVVVEMENEDKENTPQYLKAAREYILDRTQGE